MILPVAASVLLVLLWVLALRKWPAFGFGLAAGVALACVGQGLLPHVTLGTLPVWLPALPFALVALTLFGFGVLAWYWGTDR
jgi:hypothetical protein